MAQSMVMDQNVGAIWMGEVVQPAAGHQCNRHCTFAHVFGNVYCCLTSQQTHVCDQTCSSRVWYDSHSSICRLSKRVFPHAAADLPPEIER